MASPVQSSINLRKSFLRMKNFIDLNFVEVLLHIYLLDLDVYLLNGFDYFLMA